LRLDFAPHDGTVSDFDPGVGLKLIRIARDSIEELAGDMAAVEHEVSGEALRKTDKSKRDVAHHSADRPLNPAEDLGRLCWRNGRLHLARTAHPCSEPLHGQKIEGNAEKVSMNPASAIRAISAGVVRMMRRTGRGVNSARRGAGGRPSSSEPRRAMAHTESQPLERTEQGIKREERIGEMKGVPNTRAEERAQRRDPSDSAARCEGRIHLKTIVWLVFFPAPGIVIGGHEPLAETQNVRDSLIVPVETLRRHRVGAEHVPGKE